jgi:hypothetical protein
LESSVDSLRRLSIEVMVTLVCIGGGGCEVRLDELLVGE